MPSTLLSNASTNLTADIKSFLSRPRRIREGTITTSSTGVIEGFTTPSDIFSAFPMMSDKISGFYGFRGTTVIKLQFNANPFQQGRFILGYIPVPVPVFPNIDRMRSLTQITQLPHVQIDLACDTEAEIKIPFIAPFTHWAIVPSQLNQIVADIFLYTYSPLVVGAAGSQSCTYTMWAHFEDVELVAPTLPQSSATTGGNRSKIKRRTRKELPSISEQEQDAVGVGPISTGLRGVSLVASAFEKVPLVSWVAGKVRWATDIMSRAAASLGYSNPLNEELAHRMQVWNWSYAVNCDNIDNSYPIGLFSSNKVQLSSETMGTDIDEMNITYLASIPAYIEKFTWRDTDVQGTQLWIKNLDPNDFYDTVTVPGATDTAVVKYHAPFSYLAQMFNQYRGSITFTFKIVKTTYHSGRLLLAYVPGIPSASFTIDDTSYLHREIIDVREGNEFTYTIPYVSLTPYKTLHTTPTYYESSSSSYGTVAMFVLNDLVYPDSAASSVEILVECSMAEDVEFAVPRDHNPVRVFAQSGGPTDINPCTINKDEGNFGGASRTTDMLSSASHCVGERALSILQLLKRSSFIRSHNSTSFSVKPYYLEGDSLSGAGVRQVSSFSMDYFCLFGGMYRFNRGGMRIRSANLASTNGLNRCYMIIDPTLNNFVDAPTINETTTPVIPSTDAHSLGSEVQVPMYYATYMRNNFYGEMGDPINIQVRKGSGACNIYRQVADDFQFGYFIGCPGLVTFETTVP